MPAGDQAVDRRHAALGRDDELGPAVGRPAPSRRRRRRSRARARRSCRRRSTRLPPARVAATGRAVAAGTRNRSGYGRLAALERRHAGVQDDRRDADAAGDQRASITLGREGPARARHLGAAGLGGVHGLVVGERAQARRRSRRDRPPVRGRGRPSSGAGGGERRPPTAGAAGEVGRDQRRPPAPPGSGERVSPARPPSDSGARLACAARRRRTRPPSVRARPRREPASRGGARRARRRRASTGSAAGSVAEVLTTSRSPAREEVGQVAEARVLDGLVARRATSSRTSSRCRPRASGGSPASLGRQVEASARAAVLVGPAASWAPRARGAVAAARAASPSISAQQAGHAVLGRRPVGDVLAGERVLVHAACACRRGRRRTPAAPGCSAARTRVSCSSAAFDEP